MNNKIIANKVIKALEIIFPPQIADEWDKTGLQVGKKKKVIKNIMVALDFTTDVFEQAVANQIDMIIVHHPFLFEENDFLKTPKSKWKKDLMERMNNLGMVLYVIHTNFDNEPKGMSLAVKNFLQLKNKKSIKGLNYGFIVNWTNSISKLIRFLNDKNIEVKETNANRRMKIKNVAFLPGSGSSTDVQKAFNSSDVVITSDIKWSEWIDYKENNINVIEVSHSIENAFIEHIYLFLLKITNDLKIIKYKK